jgi:hypothetical protein
VLRAPSFAISLVWSGSTLGGSARAAALGYAQVAATLTS